MKVGFCCEGLYKHGFGFEQTYCFAAADERADVCMGHFSPHHGAEVCCDDDVIHWMCGTLIQ